MTARTILISALVLWATSFNGVTAQPAPQIRLDSLRVQLLYETSGTLSPNIAPPATFTLFNSTIGEGDAREPASDVLISVVVTSSAAQANLTRPVALTVRGRGGRVLARRSFDGVFVTSRRAVRSLLAQDITCAGPVTIEATYGTQRKTATLNFLCGE